MTAEPPVRVVDTGVANVASLLAAFERLGTDAALTGDPADVAEAPHLVLPGVGAFGAGMATLRDRGLVEPLRQRLSRDASTLAVCLGLQLLARQSDESPGAAGLGVVEGRIEAFPPKVRTPQFGWNRVVAGEGCELVETGYAYFANSHRLADAPPGWAVARAEHGGPFVAAMERGRTLACQFHPELSGPWGEALLARWLRRGGRPC